MDDLYLLKSQLSSMDANVAARPAAKCMAWYVSAMLSYSEKRYEDCVSEMEQLLNMEAYTSLFDEDDAAAFDGLAPHAKCVLGELLFKGCGVAQKTQQAVKLWEDAAQAGMLQEKYAGLLGKAYLDGVGTSIKVDEGLELLQTAASKKDISALISLGIRYVRGDVVPKDPDRGVSLLEQAHSVEVAELHDKGDMIAAVQLAHTLLSGDHIPRDVPRAISLLREAASLGSTEAKFAYGMLYMNLHGKIGEEITGFDHDFSDYGFGKDSETIARGAELIKEAAENGHRRAAEELKAMELAAEDKDGTIISSYRSHFENPDRLHDAMFRLSLPWYMRCARRACARRSSPCTPRLSPDAFEHYYRTLRSAGVHLLQNRELSTAINTRVSSSLLANRKPGRGVVVLEYTRSPAAMLRTWQESSDLERIRNDLEDAGLSWNLPNGGKIFVRPLDFPAVMSGIESQGWKLRPWHVVVAADMEDLVRGALESALATVPKKERGRCKVKQRSEVPIGSGSSTETLHSSRAQLAPQSFFVHECKAGVRKSSTHGASVLVKRTFLQISLPSSLLDSLSSHPATV
jgi:TPR repeat protein